MNKSLRAVPALLLTTSLTLCACSVEGKDQVTMSASTKSGISPLGDTNIAMKTSRPNKPAQLLVTDVRLGIHDSFERVVLDLDGNGDPGWFIDYTDKPMQQGSGALVQHDGRTTLNVNIDGTVYPHELNMEDPELHTVSSQGGFISQVISTGTYEGRSQFFICLDETRPYSVQVLEDPKRIVIDILR
ncbi:AMIN-like domain-containing (lipo)protein [Corynebacterium stationis]|uniref:AMIN-like domain-containing protein n=1 Tax=Corynebacterium stationis TaxID=1705 RepID=A0AB36CIX8_9CORY|nr:hypothetical protein [Corynebacterium stationis]NME88655.1 hypothetical protein [Corynebacterium stationis]